MADIHANAAALQAVVHSPQFKKVDCVFVLGDSVGYYYDAALVWRIICEFKHVEIISGNHEAMLKQAMQDAAVRSSYLKKYGSGLEAALEQLDAQQLSEITDMPQQRLVTVDGLTFLLCHSVPVAIDKYLYYDSPSEDFEFTNSFAADYICLGHTHHPMVSKRGHTMLINPGSVGQSRQIGGMAQWGILNTQTKAYSPVATRYSADELIVNVQSRDPDLPYLWQVLQR